MQIADIEFFVIMMFFTLYVIFRALEVLSKVVLNMIEIKKEIKNNGTDKK